MECAYQLIDVSNYPAPWELKGSGIIIPYFFSKQWQSENFPDFKGRWGAVMCVNYSESPVGPYREWMLIPGRRSSPVGDRFSIAHIVVDSIESVTAGQQNWGIPKEHGEFQWQQANPNCKVTMHSNNFSLSLHGAAIGLPFPIHSGLLPFELYQERLGTDFWTKPKAKGWAKWLRLSEYQHTSDLGIDLNLQKPLCALFISNFCMTFPVAKTK